MADRDLGAFESLIFMVAKGFLNYSLIKHVKIKGNIKKGDHIATGFRRAWEDLRESEGWEDTGRSKLIFFFYEERRILAMRKRLTQIAEFSRKQDVEEVNLETVLEVHPM